MSWAHQKYMRLKIKIIKHRWDMCHCKKCWKKYPKKNKTVKLLFINLLIWTVAIDDITNWYGERGSWVFENVSAAVVTDSEKEQESFKDSAVAPINTPTLVSKVSASATPGAIETKIQKAIVTTYNAEVAQTDADPFTMASGKRVYEGAIASNCHKIGTKIQIRDLGEFTVEDRMNSRYTKDCGTENERLDIFKWNRVDNFKKIAEYAIAEAESHKEVSSL